MKKLVFIGLLALTGACKKEEVKKCWDCTQTLDKFEGSKRTTTTYQKEMCSEISRDFFLSTYTYSRDCGTFKEIGIAKCNLKN